MKNMIRFAAAAVLGLLGTAAAQATSFTLNCDTQQNCSNSFNFGTITLTQNSGSPNTVTVSVSLAAGDEFVTTSSTHQALGFNITGDPAITISGLTSGYSVGTAPGTAAPYGSFDYTIVCSGCGPGASSPVGSTLSFTVGLSSLANLSVGSFTTSGGYSFVADVYQPNCVVDGKSTDGSCTGSVASNTDPSSATPEPSTMLLMISGLVCVGLGKAKRALRS